MQQCAELAVARILANGAARNGGEEGGVGVGFGRGGMCREVVDVDALVGAAGGEHHFLGLAGNGDRGRGEGEAADGRGMGVEEEGIGEGGSRRGRGVGGLGGSGYYCCGYAVEYAIVGAGYDLDCDW